MRRNFLLAITALMLPKDLAARQYPRRSPNRGQVEQPQWLRDLGNDVLIRIIKEDRILELWKLGSKGWAKARTYEICAYSGTLGPKLREGDLQAPEGFYQVTLSSLNPFSVEYLSFNLGYPNARDRASGRTGSYLMVHGGCGSAGCFAMTDEGIEEIYAAVRDALLGGQAAVQVQIYPFKMTDQRMDQEQRNPHYRFWRELKPGWDRFESQPSVLAVSVHRGRYLIGSSSGT